MNPNKEMLEERIPNHRGGEGGEILQEYIPNHRGGGGRNPEGRHPQPQGGEGGDILNEGIPTHRGEGGRNPEGRDPQPHKATLQHCSVAQHSTTQQRSNSAALSQVFATPRRCAVGLGPTLQSCDVEAPNAPKIKL